MNEVLRSAAAGTRGSLTTGPGIASALALAATVVVATLVAEVVGVRTGWLRRAIAVVPVALVLSVGIVALAAITGLGPKPTPVDAVLDALGVAVALLAIVAAIAVGTLLLVAPGLAAAVLLVYVVPIVVLDRTSPVTACVESGEITIQDPYRSIPVAGAAVAGLLASGGAGVGTTVAIRAAAGVRPGEATGTTELIALSGGAAVAGVGAAVVVVFLLHAYRTVEKRAADEESLTVDPDST